MSDKNERKNDQVILNKIDNLLEFSNRLEGKIDDIHKVVHGNGEPEKGLIVQHHKIKEKVSQMVEQTGKMAERITCLENWRWYIGGGLALFAFIIIPLAYIVLR